MGKGKKSLYTAFTSIILTMINGLLGLIVVRYIISYYGSDFNGLNATASQLINMLLIVEGGFTLATNVALFKPLAEGNYPAINSIMAATKNIFLRIGAVFLVIGIIAAVGYTLVVKSDLPRTVIFLIFLMTVFSTAFNLLYAAKYRILLETEQREYILNFVTIGTSVLTQALILAVVFFHGHVLLVRFTTMMGLILNSILIGYAGRKYYRFLDFTAKPDYKAIKGTKDVFAQKITGMIYGTIPIIFISATAGTLYASVYAVYNSIFSLLKNIIFALVNAPRMGFGQLMAEKDKKYVLAVFVQYEYIVINALLCLLTTAAVLIMPFISIYTAGIGDIEYRSWYVAILLIGITFFEVIHIPSGHIINMSGKFKVLKNIQIKTCVVLIAAMYLGNYIWGFYGILGSVLIAAVMLAVLEISYVHKIYFERATGDFLKIVIPNVVLSCILAGVETVLLPEIRGYPQFMLAGLVLVLVNGSLIIFFSLLANRKITLEIYGRLKSFAGRVTI